VRGRNAKLVDWLADVTADCPRVSKRSVSDVAVEQVIHGRGINVGPALGHRVLAAGYFIENAQGMFAHGIGRQFAMLSKREPA